MSQAIIKIYINIINFVLISYLGKDHNMIETRLLKKVIIFFQITLSFGLLLKPSVEILLFSLTLLCLVVTHVTGF